ncbi:MULTISPECIES: sugar ABC transporter permease [unclassified Oceanispirochaeta]|uniref:ABC transporter permease n=1 Tax=unclassified Oceanispirochaeta TaxID=2635722 RepID=UPI001E4B9F0D|nr:MULTISPECIES: ABC transporter permease subunit [unclassified Oceanispirochaeta]
MTDLRIAGRKAKKHWQFYVIILLPLLYLIIFKYIPMFGLQIGFKQYRVSKGIWGSEWVGLKNFIRFFSSPSSMQIIWNTISLSLYSILISFPFAIILAVALNEAASKRYKKFTQMITYMPYFISTVVLVSMIIQFTDTRMGLVNHFIGLFGMKPVNFMAKPDLFRHIYVWTNVWQTTGYNAIIYLAALTTIDPQLYEAAKVDGCSRVQKILHIDLPGIQSTVIILLILNMGYVMSIGFEKAYLMQNGLNLQTSEIISTYIYRIGLINSDFSFSTAVGFFNSIINLVLLLTVNKLARKTGETGLW